MRSLSNITAANTLCRTCWSALTVIYQCIKLKAETKKPGSDDDGAVYVGLQGEPTDLAAMTPEEGKDVMDRWSAWMEKTGPALKDVGAPFGTATAMIDDGSTGTATAASGYSIIEAEDLSGARQITEGHAYLSEGKGNYSIDIYELKPVPFEA